MQLEDFKDSYCLFPKCGIKNRKKEVFFFVFQVLYILLSLYKSSVTHKVTQTQHFVFQYIKPI